MRVVSVIGLSTRQGFSIPQAGAHERHSRSLSSVRAADDVYTVTLQVLGGQSHLESFRNPILGKA